MPSGHRFDTNHASAFASSPNCYRAALSVMPLRYDFPGAPLVVSMWPIPYLIYIPRTDWGGCAVMHFPQMLLR